MTAHRRDSGEKQMHFSTSTTDGVATLRIEGELDAVTAPDLRPSVEALLAKRPARVVVDVSELRLIDSCGVGGLVLLCQKAKEYGGVVTIHGLSNQPAVMLKLLRLDPILQA